MFSRIKCIFLLIFILSFFSCSNSNFSQVHLSKQNQIEILVKDIDDGHVHFFVYKYVNVNVSKKIEFFIRMDGKGDFHGHFNACNTCYLKKKGYEVDGTAVLCRECNKSFKLAEPTWYDSGGCVPVNIKSRIKDGKFIISKDEIEKGKKYF